MTLQRSLAHVQAMARNDAWSNHRLLKACLELTQDEFEAKRVSFFPSQPTRCSPALESSRRSSTSSFSLETPRSGNTS